MTPQNTVRACEHRSRSAYLWLEDLPQRSVRRLLRTLLRFTETALSGRYKGSVPLGLAHRASGERATTERREAETAGGSGGGYGKGCERRSLFANVAEVVGANSKKTSGDAQLAGSDDFRKASIPAQGRCHHRRPLSVLAPRRDRPAGLHRSWRVVRRCSVHSSDRGKRVPV